MDIEELIVSLAGDLKPRWSLRTTYGLGALSGTLIAFAVFVPILGMRPDIHDAVHSIRFVFKFVVTLSFAVVTMGLLFPLSRPGALMGPWRPLLALTPCLLMAAVILELVSTPPPTWGPRLVGSNALLCLVSIPLLAAGPLACLLACLRRGAPTNPGLTGAVAGLAASGIGATFYAAHCPDDSPLFVMTWYVLATLIVASIGFFAGRQLLRW